MLCHIIITQPVAAIGHVVTERDAKENRLLLYLCVCVCVCVCVCLCVCVCVCVCKRARV